MALEVLQGLYPESSLAKGLEKWIGQFGQRERTMKGLEALGFSKDQVGQLQNLPPKILEQVVQQKVQAPQQQAYAQALQGVLGGSQPQQEQFQQEQVQPQAMEDLLTNIRDQFARGEAQVSPAQKAAGITPQQARTKEAYKEEVQGEPGVSPKQEKIQNPEKRQSMSLLTAGLTPQQATELAKLGIERDKATDKQLMERYKQTAPYRKEILDATKTARQDLQSLNRMEELQDKGQLDGAGYVEFLNRSGLDIPALKNPDSQEFEKISANFLRNARQYFGNRVTNFEMESFLKTIPALSQSPEGAKRVISNLKHLNRAALEYNNTMKDVIKENNGIPPLDLQERVEDRVESRMDKIAEQLKKDLERPVPKAEPKWKTAILGATGSLLGGVGKVTSALAGLAGLGKAAQKLSDSDD